MAQADSKIWYKVLAKNDTPEAVGHQGGPLIPVPLVPLFPRLLAPSPPDSSTIKAIRVVLVADKGIPAAVSTNFQLQTWENTRREHRITGNLKPLMEGGRGDDLLLVERSQTEELWKLTRLSQGTPDFKAAMDARVRIPGSQSDCGFLERALSPTTELEISAAETQIDALAAAPFSMFDLSLEFVTSRRRARDQAFRRKVLAIYGPSCALCGGGLCDDGGPGEFEAAHVIGKTHGGSDDVRNGLALCRAHHWAFDAGLISIDEHRKVLVHPHKSSAGLSSLTGLAGRQLADPTPSSLRAHDSALRWHRETLFARHAKTA
jgi:putative restriction endonuclease